MICSECKLEIELKKPAEVFIPNGYPERVISNCDKLKIFKFNNYEKFGTPKLLVYIKISWVVSSSQNVLEKNLIEFISP